MFAKTANEKRCGDIYSLYPRQTYGRKHFQISKDTFR